MVFEEALKELKSGKKITNKNWNGKDMYLFMQPGYLNGVPANEVTAKGMGIPVGKEVKVDPYIMMVNADGFLVPWTPSQMDLFSLEWEVV